MVDTLDILSDLQNQASTPLIPLMFFLVVTWIGYIFQNLFLAMIIEM